MNILLHGENFTGKTTAVANIGATIISLDGNAVRAKLPNTIDARELDYEQLVELAKQIAKAPTEVIALDAFAQLEQRMEDEIINDLNRKPNNNYLTLLEVSDFGRSGSVAKTRALRVLQAFSNACEDAGKDFVLIDYTAPAEDENSQALSSITARRNSKGVNVYRPMVDMVDAIFEAKRIGKTFLISPDVARVNGLDDYFVPKAKVEEKKETK